MAKSGDFEVADSFYRFCETGHISGEPVISEYICTLKIKGIGNWTPELATGPLSIRKRNQPLQNHTFSRLSRTKAILLDPDNA